MAIPQEIVEEIRARSDLADLISEHVQLKRSGRNLVACCPFHDEKTPSFNVNNEEGFYKCFGCGKKGDVFSFLMEMRGFSFPEAVRFLGSRLGVEIPESAASGSSNSVGKEQRMLRRVSAVAESCFRAILRDEQIGKSAREYLRGRGVTSETVETFRLGFAPDRWEYLLEAVQEQFAGGGPDALDREQIRSALITLGLIKERSEGKGCYDVFRGRVIFPIARSDGSPIAFGARLLGSHAEAPKYLNSAESPIYLKRRTLYGIPQALNALRQERLAVVVEGYTDVLALHQAGIANVVASCGTSLTEEHAAVIRRLVDRVVILFDGDDAGRKAAANCFERFLNTGVAVGVVFLPQGEDPDSLVRSGGARAIHRLIENQQRPLIDVYLAHLMDEAGLKGPEGDAALRGKVAARFVTSLAKVINPVEREALLLAGSKRLGVSESSLAALVAEQRPVSRSTFKTRARSLPNSSKQLAPSTSQQVSALSQRGLHEYVKQLLISVICEPVQAKLVLQTPSLLDGGGLIDGLPEAAAGFLRRLARDSYAGVSELSRLPAGDAQRGALTGRLHQALEEDGLPASELLEEAFRQSSIGGVEAKQVVADAARAAARSSLHREIEQLRQEEAKACSLEELQQIAQRKLQARQKLDRMQAENE